MFFGGFGNLWVWKNTAIGMQCDASWYTKVGACAWYIQPWDWIIYNNIMKTAGRIFFCIDKICHLASHNLLKESHRKHLFWLSTSCFWRSKEPPKTFSTKSSKRASQKTPLLSYPSIQTASIKHPFLDILNKNHYKHFWQAGVIFRVKAELIVLKWGPHMLKLLI